MNKIITTTLIAAFVLLSVGCKNRQGQGDTPAAAENADTLATAQAPIADSTTLIEMEYEPKFEIKTDKGSLIIKLYEETPLHKENFIKLATGGFYDSTLFHRVINGFMIQCGDPLTKDLNKADEWGTGGPGYTIPAEIIPGFTHKKGALAAARRGDFVNPAKASSGSQFYIVQDSLNCSHLDGEYTIFGEVIKGLDIIDKIAGVPTDAYDRPVTPITITAIVPFKEK